jgi:hypothetical protein
MASPRLPEDRSDALGAGFADAWAAIDRIETALLAFCELVADTDRECRTRIRRLELLELDEPRSPSV